jgi:hypothetical protein
MFVLRELSTYSGCSGTAGQIPQHVIIPNDVDVDVDHCPSWLRPQLLKVASTVTIIRSSLYSFKSINAFNFCLRVVGFRLHRANGTLSPSGHPTPGIMLPVPLTASSPRYLHQLQNVALILLSAFFAPLCTFIAVVSHIVSPYTKTAKHIKHHRKWRASSLSTFRPRTVLVTGVGMSKGLVIARAFYRAGHRVIGADFEPYAIPVCGHFSASIEKFFRLTQPDTEETAEQYIQELRDIIESEDVELWVPCSSGGFSIEDGEAAEALQKQTNCKVIQFGVTLTETLHQKHSFIDNTRSVGLNVPETHLVTSETESLTVLYPEKEKSRSKNGIRYIMKSALDDSFRGDLTLLPRPTLRETGGHIKRLNPTPFRPFVLQQYISGPEFCTHSLIINGQVQAFLCCPSAELLMHYNALPNSLALSKAMLLYTSIYAKATGPNMTGHLSIDFLIDESITQKADKIGVSDSEIRELMDKIFPIECNPRPNTAVVLFADESEDLAEAYLSILPDHEPKGIKNGHRAEALIVPKPSVPGYYWIGHDLVTRVLIPLLAVLRWEMGLWQMLGMWMEFLEHVVYWRDGTYEVWDPWPAWWLYVVYWPGMFLISLWKGRWWSRCNVSTTKIFWC